MNRPNPLFLRALLLLIVAVGPLQAQTLYACAMMDTGVLDGCCCEAHKTEQDCASPDCNASVESGDKPCCERSVEVSIDQEAGKETLTVKPTDVRSDVDPPHALVCSFVTPFPQRPFPAQGVVDRAPGADRSGSDIWLLTRRLRI